MSLVYPCVSWGKISTICSEWKKTQNANTLSCLTHWGRVTYICIGNLTIIGSDNGLSPGWRQAQIHVSLTHWGRVTYICVSNLTIIGSDNGLSAPSHYLNQCWNIVNWTPRNKFQWNVNRNSYIFFQENPLENGVWKMVSILSRPQCVKKKISTVKDRKNGLHQDKNRIQYTIIYLYIVFIQFTIEKNTRQ